MSNNTLFVLGGNDAEMCLIQQLLTMHGQSWVQPNVDWGDHVYGLADLGLKMRVQDTTTEHGHTTKLNPPQQYIDGGTKVIFVECRPSEDWPKNDEPMVIDHHGDRSGEPASVLQVLDLLMPEERTLTYSGGQQLLPDTETRSVERQISSATLRWVELVAANDSGYIPAMVALGATNAEVKRIRALERSAQGITPEQEKEAVQAISLAKNEGRLTLIRMSHSKTAVITDRLYGQYDQLLILSEDGEVNFFGDGALCAQLEQKFGGWSGGSGRGKEAGNGFWGGYHDHREVERFIRERFE